MNEIKPAVAIVGGSGQLGSGLSQRWARAGYPVIIGSRTQEKAESAAQACRRIISKPGLTDTVDAMDNLAAARAADIVVMTVPFAHHQSTLAEIGPALAGKILVDTTVPLVPPRVARVQLPEGGSAGQMAQDLLGEEVNVVSAFQNVPAQQLQETEEPVDCDVLVTGNSKLARSQVIKLVEAAGMRGFHAGLIYNAAAAEAMTSVLININRQFKSHAGIRITGVDDSG